jgi:hypothetical protein
MVKKVYQHGPWSVSYSPEDGARLDHLKFNNYDLLTTEPKSFRPPTTDYGLYEIRPVYGYDDCFPSCDPCKYPGSDWNIPDHGEICWLKWMVTEEKNRLLCNVKSKALPVIFKREMIFNENNLVWKFEVQNNGDVTMPFVHIIHPLMPLDEIIDIKLPEFETAYDEIADQTMDLKDEKSIKKFLFNQKKGTANMLFLQNVQSGKMSWIYKNNLQLKMNFPVELFPTIGIWWNNTAYPDEDGCRRNECAFEPVPGPVSVLTDAYKNGSCLSVPPRKSFTWEITWEISLV